LGELVKQIAAHLRTVPDDDGIRRASLGQQLRWVVNQVRRIEYLMSGL
jgi:hypothetical protein